MDIKSVLKTIKLNEPKISMFLGALVIVVLGLLLFNSFRSSKNSSISSTSNVQEETTKTHKVVKGETLWSISEKYYSTGYEWKKIAEANNIDDTNSIEVGQELSIPASGQVTKEAAATENESAVSEIPQQPVVKSNEPITSATYSVIKGDNLWKIAVRAYGDGFKWVEIARENKLVNPNLIHPGNILIIPRS